MSKQILLPLLAGAFLSGVLAGPAEKAAAAPDPLEIVRRSVDHDQTNWQRQKDYTYIVRSSFEERDSKGKVKSVKREAKEVLVLYGEPYERLIEKDGKPLPEKEQKKEQEKLDKVAAKRANESDEEREKRLAKLEKERREEREFAREIPEAYDFELIGEEVVNNRTCWVIGATPREGYKPRNSRARILQKFRGKMWIDQTEYQWVKMEGEAIDTLSWGWLLARLAKGSKIYFEQARVNDEVWMPKQIRVELDARLALLKRVQGDIAVHFENFRKFQSDSRIVTAGELNPDPFE